MTGPSNPGFGRAISLGEALAYGLSGGVNNFIQTNNQFEQQRQQQANLEAQRLYQQQQAEEQKRQWQATFDANQTLREYEKERQTRLDAITERENEKNRLATIMNGFMVGAGNESQMYAPTLKDGRPNPQFNPALYQAAQERAKQAQKLWNNFHMSVGSGKGFDEARQAFLEFTGGDLSPMPQTPQTPPAMPPVQMGQPMTGTPLPGGQPAGMPAPVTVQGGGGTEFTYTPEAQTPASDPATTALTQQPAAAPQPGQQATPATKLPARIQDIRPSDLETLNDEDLLRTYGQGGLDYARAARLEIDAARKAAAAKTRQDQVDFWKKKAQAIGEDKDHPATATQLNAAATVIALVNKTEPLTDEEATRFGQAVRDLAPAVLNAKSWQDVLDTKDDAVILATYDMYAAQAPDVVKGYNIEPIRARLQSKLDLDAADRILKEGQAANSEAQTNKTNTESDQLVELLPYKKTEYDDKHAYAGAQLKDLQATTDLTLAKVEDTKAGTALTLAKLAGEKTDQAAKLLAQFSTLPPDMSYDQAARSAPQLVSQLKGLLGVNDQGLLNLWRQGQYSYGQGLRGKELENQLKGSQILTENANRGLKIAQTGQVQAETTYTRAKTLTENELRDPKVRQADAAVRQIETQIDLATKQGQNIDSLIRERDRLVGSRDALLQAQAGQAAASTALTWANVSKVQQDLKNDRVKLNAELKLMEGKYAVDTATVQNLMARTALTRSQDPNDPLYRPELKQEKPGNPYTELKQKAELQFYTPMSNSLKEADKQQGIVDALVKQYTGASGSVNQTKLAADPSYQKAVQARDAALKKAQDYRQRGDAFVTTSMAGLDKKTGNTPLSAPKVQPGLSGAQQWAAQNVEVPGVSSDCAAIAGKYLSDLGLNLKPSNLSAQLEKNAIAAKWAPVPATGTLKQGDLVVWTGPKYGLQKNGGVGKHVGVVAGFQNGKPMILQNPGLLPNGQQGKTEVIAMRDEGNARVYRSPQSGALNHETQPPAPQATQPTATQPAPGKPAVQPAVVKPGGTPLPSVSAGEAPALPKLPKYTGGGSERAASIYAQNLIKGIQQGNAAQIKDAGEKLFRFGYTNEQIQAFALEAQKAARK